MKPLLKQERSDVTRLSWREPGESQMKKLMNDVLEEEEGESDSWGLCLYILDASATSIRAFNNLKKVCEEHLAGRYTLEVIDLAVNPELAKRDEIVAVPTLVKRLPLPCKKMIGDFSNIDRVLTGLGLN